VQRGASSLDNELEPLKPTPLDCWHDQPASKTALNAVTLAMVIKLEPEEIKVNGVSPGTTKTNLNNYASTETVEEGAEAVRIALLGSDGSTGTFIHARLGQRPW
jgi:NAD(P)-dependent dehydrogenase (short-subunit alcohol dehydrogenase family)